MNLDCPRPPDFAAQWQGPTDSACPVHCPTRPGRGTPGFELTSSLYLSRNGASHEISKERQRGRVYRSAKRRAEREGGKLAGRRGERHRERHGREHGSDLRGGEGKRL